MSASATSCARCPLRKKRLFTPFTEEEIAFMEGFKVGELRVNAGTEVLMEGSNSPHVFTVLEGMGTRYKLLEDGRRQVLNFVFPGDFLGLQAGVMGEMKHSVSASTPMILCVFPRGDLWNLFRTSPARAYDLTWIAAVEEYFLGETIATLGQRSAADRVGWALLRIYQRLRAIDLGEEGRVPLPFRQHDLADALGLSVVHTNKTLARLKAQRLAVWSKGWLSVPNPPAMEKACGAGLGLIQERPIL